jgi:phosphohistidine phosphatase
MEGALTTIHVPMAAPDDGEPQGARAHIMELILWRHADAEDGSSDKKRELTEKGRAQASRMAAWLQPRLEGEWRIVSSPATRARQTADALGLDYEVCLTLGPQGTEDALLREAGWPAADRPVLVVGHQPAIGRLAARFLTGHLGDLTVKKGSVWWFSSRLDEEVGTGVILLRAVIAPDLAD